MRKVNATQFWATPSARLSTSQCNPTQKKVCSRWRASTMARVWHLPTYLDRPLIPCPLALGREKSLISLKSRQCHTTSSHPLHCLLRKGFSISRTCNTLTYVGVYSHCTIVSILHDFLIFFFSFYSLFDFMRATFYPCMWLHHISPFSYFPFNLRNTVE